MADTGTLSPSFQCSLRADEASTTTSLLAVAKRPLESLNGVRFLPLTGSSPTAKYGPVPTTLPFLLMSLACSVTSPVAIATLGFWRMDDKTFGAIVTDEPTL